MSKNADLVARLRSGDEGAWRQFMADYGRLIFLIAKRVGLPEQDREEVFQNTCLSVLRFIESLRDPEKITSWVYSISYRHALDLLKKQRSADPHALASELDQWTPSALEAVERLDQAERLLGVIEELPERCRNILHSIYLDKSHPSYEEIARREGIPVGSIGPTRARCLKKLRRLLFKVSRGATFKST
jgi:RNA polymerase sigma factor (sigma-70 family)